MFVVFVVFALVVGGSVVVFAAGSAAEPFVEPVV